jgi:hypothetical protein
MNNVYYYYNITKLLYNITFCFFLVLVALVLRSIAVVVVAGCINTEAHLTAV